MSRLIAFKPSELSFSVERDRMVVRLDVPYQPDVLGEALITGLARQRSAEVSRVWVDARCFGQVELTLKVLTGIELVNIYQRLVEKNDVRIAFMVSPEHLGSERPADDHFRETGVPMRVFCDPVEAESWLSELQPAS